MLEQTACTFDFTAYLWSAVQELAWTLERHCRGSGSGTNSHCCVISPGRSNAFRCPQNVLKLYMDYDMALFDQCAKEYLLQEQAAASRNEKNQGKWKIIEHMAVKKTESVPHS